MKSEFISKYFYYFLKFILLFDGSEAMTETRKRKEVLVNKMRQICGGNRLSSADSRFSELVEDIDKLVNENGSLEDLDFDYSAFIESVNIDDEASPINQYFFYFLKFYVLFNNPEHIKVNYDKKKEYDNKMTKIATEDKLKEIDQRFIEMVWDMDYEITTNHGVHLIIQNYKDFINKYEPK